MKVISDKITMAVATSLHSFDLLPTTAFEDMQEKLSEDAVIKRYRNDHVFHAKVCSITASVLPSVGDEIATLTRQRDLAVEALKWLKLIFTDSEMSQERNPELWMPTVEEAIKESEAK